MNNLCTRALRLFAFGLLATTAIPTLAAPKMSANRVDLMATPLAKNAGLQGATGYANVDAERRAVKFSFTLAPGTKLPAGSVLEGWLSTSGLDTASMADQKYGPAFGKAAVATKSRAIPYALSTGLLRRVGTSRTYVGNFKIDNPFTPYGAVAVTLESDGNNGTYDPRPGTPILAGMTARGKMGGTRMSRMSR